MVEDIILCTIFGTFIILSYTLGLRNGQKLDKKEEIKLPNVNPIKAIDEELERHSQKKKQNMNEILNYNIDNYDGTGLGQKDIPR